MVPAGIGEGVTQAMIDERTLRTLEFYKVRSLLAQKAATYMGRERCEQLLPSTDFLEVEHRQHETTEARALQRGGKNLPLGGIHDLREAVRRCAAGGVLHPQELLDVADTAAGGRRLRKFLLDNRDLAPVLSAHGNQINPFAAVEAEIRQAITEQGEVADDASPTLSSIRKQMRVLQSRVRERLDAMIRNPNMRQYLQEALVTIRDDRYVLPVKIEHRGQVPGIVHDQSASGSTLFIEPMAIVELNNDAKKLALEEREEIYRILTRLSGLIGQEEDEWLQTLQALAHLDLCSAKALLGQTMDAVPPEMNTRGEVVIRRGRHPLLAVKPVPVDVHLGKSFDVLVITGPNTGGKTVSMKIVGLFCLMAQAGLQVPAGYGTELAVFQQVFADIGDEQSIEQSLSTFSGHMTHIVRILDELDQGALVLLDELGAGTDPQEGAALAMSILEHLQARQARVLATTHYPELKAFAFTRPRVENASVEFDIETLQPTYKLLIGIPGASQAFEISRRLGLSPVLVERARAYLSRDEEKVEEMLKQIMVTRSQLEQERDAATASRAEANRLRAEAEERLRNVRGREQELIDKARADANRILADVRREAETLIDELKEARKHQATQDQNRALEQARQRMRTMNDHSAALQPKVPAPPGEALSGVRPGEQVRLRSHDVLATVLSGPDAAGQVVVQAGIMKLTVALTDLDRPRPEKARKTGHLPAGGTGAAGYRTGARVDGVTAGSARTAAFSPEVDLRGMTVEEALEKVDKYLDDAMLAGAEQVRIIHGKGTGALRAAVQQYLKTHRLVHRHRLGGVGEGGDGCTVAILSEN